MSRGETSGDAHLQKERHENFIESPLMGLYMPCLLSEEMCLVLTALEEGGNTW